MSHLVGVSNCPAQLCYIPFEGSVPASPRLSPRESLLLRVCCPVPMVCSEKLLHLEYKGKYTEKRERRGV